MNPLKILLVGGGGYAATYVNEIKARGEAGGLKIEGVVDPYIEKAVTFETLRGMNAAFFDTLEEFY
jgi:predicted dehydrogenase